jgi:hypothetical protein
MGKDTEGAGGIETNTAYSLGVYIVLTENSLHTNTDTAPYICGRLFL